MTNSVPNKCVTINNVGRRVFTINDVPKEVLVNILSYVPVEDVVLRVPRVCKRWENVAQDSDVWKGKVFHPSVNSAVEAVVSILERTPKLEGICVSEKFNCSSTYNYYITSICKALCESEIKLQRIKIPVKLCTSPVKLCTSISDVKDVILRHCESIKSLDLLINCRCSDELHESHDASQILEVISKCTNLKYLTLSGRKPSYDYNICFAGIARCCKNLKSVDIQDYIINSPPSLKTLLNGSFDNITSLSIPWSVVDVKSSFKLVANHCQELKKLCVAYPEKFCVTSHHIEALQNFKFLKELSLQDLKVDVLGAFIGVVETGALMNLEKLDLCRCSWVKTELLDCIFRKCPNLNSLDLKYSHHLKSSGFENIHRLKHLFSLNLEGCTMLRDSVLPFIFRVKTLKYLNLRYINSFSGNFLTYYLENFKDLIEVLHEPISELWYQ